MTTAPLTPEEEAGCAAIGGTCAVRCVPGWHYCPRHLQQPHIGEEWEASKVALAAARAEVERLREALTSIASNSCCEPCREAGLVARAALASSQGEKK